MTDCIYRDVLLKIISHKPSSPTTEREDRLINSFISVVKNCPAADVRPVVKARWNVGADGWECSNCTIESNNTYPICPYCGAEMRPTLMSGANGEEN